METTSGTKVYICRDGGDWLLLSGYAGGLAFGFTTSLEQVDGSDNGIPDFIKGNSSGASSQIAFREVAGDAGQEAILDLSRYDNDGLGAVRAVRKGGQTTTAQGIFHGASPNSVDPDLFIGYSVSFTQIAPEERSAS